MHTGPWRSLVPAIVLVVVTLGTFVGMSEYGPMHAVRDVHRALAIVDYDQRVEALRAATVVPPPQLRAVHEDLLQRTAENEHLRGGALGRDFQVRGVDSGGLETIVAIVYPSTYPYLWVVENTGRGWKVNLERTYAIGAGR